MRSSGLMGSLSKFTREALLARQVIAGGDFQGSMRGVEKTGARVRSGSQWQAYTERRESPERWVSFASYARGGVEVTGVTRGFRTDLDDAHRRVRNRLPLESLRAPSSRSILLPISAQAGQPRVRMFEN
jgi:hypothetical protein